MNKCKKIPIFVLSVSVIVTSVCYGAWVFPTFNYRKDDIITKPATPVCYTKDSNNKKIYFMSIEKALTVAGNNSTNDTIYVIPGTNPVIAKDCSLNKQDTLLIPYENETYYRDIDTQNFDSDKRKEVYNAVAKKEFSDNDSQSVLSNRKNELIISNNVKFTNNGTILVGGQLGIGENGQRPSGHTNGLYTQITLKDGASIENNGTIDLFGYIKKDNKNGTGKLVSKDKSSITMPLVINDYKGGSFSAASVNQHVFPFSIFELVNIQCITDFEYGSTLNVRTAIYKSTGQTIYVPDLSKLIGSSGALFNITKGKVILDYSAYNFPYTNIDNISNQDPSKISRMNISFNGNATLDTLTLSLADQEVVSSEYNVPLSYKFAIKCLNGSNVNISKKTKFLSGSSLIVEEGANLTFNADSVFYQDYIDNSTYVAGKYPKTLGPAILAVDGTLTINAAFGGKIITNKSTGKLVAGTSFSNSITTHEIITAESLGSKWTYAIITTKAFGEIKSNTSSSASNLLFKNNNTYNANNGIWVGTAGGSDISQGYSTNTGSCVLPTSKVLLPNGTYKLAGDIRTGDVVMSFNHETGKLEPNIIIINDDIDKEAQLYNVVHLEFENKKSTDFVYEHGYFDVTINKYVYLHEHDINEYIGHEFVFIENGKIATSKLIRFSIKETYTTLCSPVTANHLNIIADDMLSVGGGLSGLFNIFEYDKDTIAFNKEKMQEDINKYGLLDYSYFEKYFPRELYDLLPCKYMGVAIGKGLITWNIIEEYISKWHDQLIENVN